MDPHPRVVQHLAQHYPKPKVDEKWLQACYEWVLEENGLDPERDFPTVIKHIEEQLLGSDLIDSMQPNTGLARNIPTAKKGATGAVPTLVQIVAITDIGQSAFNLRNVRQTRIDRADLAGLAEQDGGEDDGPIPKYPRSMLRFKLSDGQTTIDAVEFRRIPELSLDETPLGYKMQLKSIKIKRGIAFLEPNNVILKGGHVEDLDANRDGDFLQGLHLRINPNGIPDGEEEEVDDPPAQPPRAIAAPIRVAAPPQPPARVPVSQQATLDLSLSARQRASGQADTRTKVSQPTTPTTATRRANGRSAAPAPSASTSIQSSSQKSYSAAALTSARRLAPTRTHSLIDIDALPDEYDDDDDDVARAGPSHASSDYGDVEVYDDDFIAHIDEVERMAVATDPTRSSQRVSNNSQAIASQGTRNKKRKADDNDDDIIEIATDEEEAPPSTQARSQPPRRTVKKHGTIIELD